MSSKKELLEKLANCVVEMEDEEVVDVAKEYLNEGYLAFDGIMNGLVEGMNEASRLYDEEEDWFIWLPPESLQVNIPLQETCEIQNELDFSENDKMSDFPETLSGYLFFGNDRKNILNRLATFYRDSHLAFEERGIQILRAGFGLVVRTDPSGQEFESPLIISPLEIDRKRCNDGYLYSIKLSDDDVVINPALRIEFNRQFKQELPEFSIEQLDKVGAIAYLSAYFTQIET